MLRWGMPRTMPGRSLDTTLGSCRCMSGPTWAKATMSKYRLHTCLDDGVVVALEAASWAHASRVCSHDKSTREHHFADVLRKVIPRCAG
eukprot:15479545-Alexandrium_andersonii.AAC.2